MLQIYYQHTYHEYCGNVYEFIDMGEGYKTSPTENLQIRTKYPEVRDWYAQLDQAGKKRIDDYLTNYQDCGY